MKFPQLKSRLLALVLSWPFILAGLGHGQLEGDLDVLIFSTIWKQWRKGCVRIPILYSQPLVFLIPKDTTERRTQNRAYPMSWSPFCDSIWELRWQTINHSISLLLLANIRSTSAACFHHEAPPHDAFFFLQQMLSLDRAPCQWHQEAVSPFTVRSLAEGSSGVFYFKCCLYFILHVLIKLPTRTVVSLNSIRKQGHVHLDKGTGGSQIKSLKPHSHGWNEDMTGFFLH